MEDNEITHQQALVKDSFSTIERLESEMASISREFENLENQDGENEVDEVVETEESN